MIRKLLFTIMLAWGSDHRLFTMIRDSHVFVRSDPNPKTITKERRFEMLDHWFITPPQAGEQIVTSPVLALKIVEQNDKEYTHLFMRGFRSDLDSAVVEFVPINAKESNVRWLCYYVMCFEDNCRYEVNFVDPVTNQKSNRDIVTRRHRELSSFEIHGESYESSKYWMGFYQFRARGFRMFKELSEEKKKQPRAERLIKMISDGFPRLRVFDEEERKLNFGDTIFDCVSFKGKRVFISDREFNLTIAEHKENL